MRTGEEAEITLGYLSVGMAAAELERARAGRNGGATGARALSLLKLSSQICKNRLAKQALSTAL